MTKKLMVLAATLAVAACGAGTPARIEHTASPAPKMVEAQIEAKTVRFSRFLADLKLGERLGVVRSGWLCTLQVPLIWKGDASFLNARDVVKTFNDEMVKANVPVVGDPDDLFPDPDARPDVLVSARITELKANYCHPMDDDEIRGETSLMVEWQIFDSVNRRILYKVTTRGDSELDTAVPLGRHALFYGAVAKATRALLADQTFHAIISQERSSDTAGPAEAMFRLHPRPVLGGVMARNVPDMQAATVTILIAGGHGSGFFVSANGFLLTNAHVVGDAKFVRIRLATGREIAGEVVVANRVRDVALVKVVESGLVALPIATVELPVGSDVYAIGAPLDVKLATTVTRGIVSAYRVVDGQRMIQGDVTIQHGSSGGPLVDSAGNVVGVSTSGQMNSGVSVGLNYFIPIGEALAAVGVGLGETRQAAQMLALDRSIADALQPGRQRTPRERQVATAVPEPQVQAPAVSVPAPQIAAARPPVATNATRDGDYRTKFTATTLNGQSVVDLIVSLDGQTIRGSGRTRGGLQCRAIGEIGDDGAASINVACSNSGAAYLAWQLVGQFAPERVNSGFLGRLRFANIGSAPGEAVFRPAAGNS
jgi:S1-C subfamily serine protease